MDPLDRPVEHAVEHRLPVLDVAGEDRVHQFPVDPLVLDRHLAGHEDADDRLAAAPAGAAGLVEHDVVAARGGDVLAELVEHVLRAGGVLAGGRAHLNHDPLVRQLLVPTRFRPVRQFIIAFLYRSHVRTQLT